MRIAVFVKGTTFHKNYGGLEVFNKTLCEGLSRRGHFITVFSPKRELTIDDIEQNGIKYNFVKCTYRQFFSHVDKNSWLNRSFEVFKEIHDKEPFNIVIGQSSGALGIIERKNELNVKVISISHGSILGEYKTALRNISSIRDIIALTRNTQYVMRSYFGSQREFIRSSNKIVAVSNAVKESIVEETYIPESKAEVIFNGIDETKFQQYHIDASEKNVSILFVGRIIRSKGVFFLVDVMKDMKFSNVKLNIVGEGEDMQELKSIISSNGLDSKISLHGWLKGEDVYKELFNNDIFTLPSTRVEGFPMTLVEAMFASLPIVASKIGGIPDAVEHNYNGFLVEPSNVQQLKDTLIKLVEDKDLRQKFGYNSREKAMKEFTLNTMLDKYENLLNMYVKEVR